jgi:CRP-like cAMP-binding protein
MTEFMERRLVEEPVFIMSLPRSGSTLMRCVLDSHSRVYSPPELHLGRIGVTLVYGAPRSMTAIGLSHKEVRYLLWDRILHRQLTASGKDLIVEKTPENVEDFTDLTTCWPRARFIFLRRHPVRVLRSIVQNSVWQYEGSEMQGIKSRAHRLDQALQARPNSMVVYYEEMTSKSETTFRLVCEFLGVEYEATMLDYGDFEHGALVRSLGDWNENIRSGRIISSQHDDISVEDVPEPLRHVCASWGY